MSILVKCWQVGPILSKCVETHLCKPDETAFYKKLQKTTVGTFDRFISAWISTSARKHIRHGSQQTRILLALKTLAGP